MKLFRLILIIVATSLFCSAGFAGEDYTMASGRVLKNAYIVDRKPNGVTVGHSTGVMFVKYKKMSKELRDKLGYDEAKCNKYEERRRKKKKARRERNTAKHAKDVKFRKELKNRQGQYAIYELENKIKSTELRIKRLKIEIPKLEADSKDFLNKAVSLSSSSSGGYSSGNRSNSIWGGTSSSSRNRNTYRTEVKDRFKVTKAIGEEYSTSKFRLSNYKDELERKTLQLDQMKDKLALMKKDKNAKSGKKSGFFSKFF